MMRLLRRWLIRLALALWLAPAGTACATDEVSLQLLWEPQFQFAGYYAALWQGYYAEAGLKVEIRSALLPDRRVLDPIEEVGAGRADFGIGSGDILLGRERGLDLTVVASIFQESSVALYALARTHLVGPADLLNLRVERRRGNIIDVEFETMLRNEGIDPGRVRDHPFEPGQGNLLRGDVDVAQGYTISWPYRLQEMGVAYRELRPASFGVAFYGDSLFTSGALARRDPGLVMRFKQASLKGWAYALEHKEEIAARLVREKPLDLPVRNPLDYNLWQAGKVAGLMLPDVIPIGHVNPARWARMHDQLARAGLVSRPFDRERFIFDPQLQGQRRQQMVQRSLVGGATLMLLALAGMLLWQRSLRRRVVSATAALLAARQQLEGALASMEEGFALFDADERLVLHNRRFHELFPLTADVRVPGAWLPDVIREAARRGEFRSFDASNVDEWIERSSAFRRADGRTEVELADGRWIDVVSRPTRDGGFIITYRDVTARKRLEQELEHMARHDALTGLPNRALFEGELKRAHARAERDGARLAVMLVDLDRFKEVNDSYGHAAGDALLVEVARRLQGSVRQGDLVARLGGDEFAVMAAGRAEEGSLAAVAQRVVDRLAEPFELSGLELRAGGTVGLTVYPDDPGGPEELLAHADRALYAAKAAGRGTWFAFRPDLPDSGASGAALAAEVVRAAAQGQLQVAYQPILAIDTLKVVAVEALVRWAHPERGLLAPDAFIAALERGSGILPLTRLVLEQGLAQRRTWPGDLRLWVNLAPRCLAWDGLEDMIVEALAETGTPGDRLGFEVTEGSIMALAATEARLAALRRHGITIAVDDFGTGHSSLARLKALPLDMLKIDGAFTAGIAADPHDQAIVRTIAALGREMRLGTTVEGIETLDQLAMARRLGCRLAQGYLFAKPLPAADLTAWLEAWTGHRRAEFVADLRLREPA